MYQVHSILSKVVILNKVVIFLYPFSHPRSVQNESYFYNIVFYARSFLIQLKLFNKGWFLSLFKESNFGYYNFYQYGTFFTHMLIDKIMFLNWKVKKNGLSSGTESNFCFASAKSRAAVHQSCEVVLVTELFHFFGIVPADTVSDPVFDSFQQFVAAEVVGSLGQLQCAAHVEG